MNLEQLLKTIKSLPPVAVVIGIIVIFHTGLYWFLLPVGLLIISYIIVDREIEQPWVASVFSVLIATFIMSCMGVLIHFFPNSIGTGLFADGYTVASILTLNNLIDFLWYAQTQQWGIKFDLIVVILGFLIIAIMVILNRI